MNTKARRYYHFGPFRLDPCSRVLWRGTELVPLTPKVFDTLLVLVERRGEIVGRAEIINAVWPDCFVAEGNLNSNIFMLRRTLGGASAAMDYIATIPRRGYRFIAEVREVCVSERGRAETGALMMAVLPFKLLGSAAEDEMGTGLADAIIARLSRLRQVIVRPTSAVLRYHGGEQDARLAGRELEVEAVVEGRIRRSGDRLGISVQFVSVGDGTLIWAEKFDEHLTDVLTVEDLIAGRIVAGLASVFQENHGEQQETSPWSHRCGNCPGF